MIFPWAAASGSTAGTCGTSPGRRAPTTFQFYDADGELLTLNAGRSYLALVSSVTGQELTVTNSAGENLIQ